MKEVTLPTHFITPEEADKEYEKSIIVGEVGGSVYLLNRQRTINNRGYLFVNLDGRYGAVGTHNSVKELITRFLEVPYSKVFVFENSKEFGEWLSKR